ncbi:Transcriptional regulator of various polyols utilization, AraC family [Candidatus Rhodobacter oscarellae]|uniref:Transcriptional regulator of various polyols utilization, AraC family n=1 Tax=Candidatus Rhodobacter oscarellae TaxID=1675527 RepID=A0A0J9GSS7_9RHOB|nr:AraC family transcriptional regulator [Candidatus Rhodobacter lobularis]KMW56558.1 Transcriptional regulator of various polyols utilization, AraC family [Candidatus Rhodobacter lobularis]
MIFVPVPFVVTVLLALLFMSVARRDDDHFANPPFLALIALTAIQSALIGLRFGYGVEWVRYLSPLLASVMAPLVYFGSLYLVGPRPLMTARTLAPHGIPLALVSLSLVAWPLALDAIIIGAFVAYAILTLLLLRSGTDALRLAALDGAGTTHRALVFVALVLVFSAAVDTLITLDIALMDARHLTQLVSIGNVATLLFLSVAAAVASRGRALADSAPDRATDTLDKPQPEAALTDDSKVMARIEALMTQSRIYRDADLNLDRLARRAVIPSRQISGAINRTAGKNVSQYVNDFRIKDACEQLETGTRSVTEIMFDVGFQTKSNFNREFRRVTGMAPIEWRKHSGLTSDGQS